MAGNRWSEGVGRSLAEFSIRWRWALAPCVILLCVAISYGASTLRFASDYRVFFGENNPDFIANQNAEATFGKPDNVAFVVIPESGDVYNRQTLTAVHALTEASWRLPYVSRVDSLTNFQNTSAEGDELIVEDLVLDPAALDEEMLAAVRRTAETRPLVDGFVVSRDGAATIVSATVQLPSDVPNAASSVAAAAREIREDVVAQYPGLEIHITGVASLSAAFEEAGLKDASTLIPAVYGFILIVMLIALRSVSAVVASLLVIALSTLVGMGVGGFTGVALTPISLSAPTIILTIAVADAIHVISSVRAKMREGTPKHEAIVEATSLNFTPIAITSITTVIGFLTLNFSDSPPFHHLGNISAAGIAAAWVLSVTFLPAVLSILPLRFRPAKAGAAKAGFVDRVANVVIAAPRTVLAATLAASLGAIAFMPTMTVNDQWSKYFDESLEFRQAIDASNPFFGSDTIEFVFDPGEPGAVTEPAFLNTVEAFADWLRARDAEVAHVFPLTDIIKRLNQNLNADDPAFYRIPDDRALASQYLLVYELSLPYGLDLNNRVDIDRQSTRVTATMKDISTNETRAFIDDARAWFDANGGPYRLDITGSKVLFAYVAERNISALFEGAVYLIIVIFAILALTFRSLKVGLVSLVPNVLPVLTAFGVWALLVGVVGFSVAAVGAVAVGLVVDFTVHFLAKYFRARREDGAGVENAVRYAFRTAGAAIFLTTIILAAGFSVLATSTFKLNADLGLLTAIAVVLAMLINFLVLPAAFLVAGKNQRQTVPSLAKPAEQGVKP